VPLRGDKDFYENLSLEQERFLIPVNGKKNRQSFKYQLEEYKYLGGACNYIISNYISQFLVFYDRSSGVRY